MILNNVLKREVHYLCSTQSLGSLYQRLIDVYTALFLKTKPNSSQIYQITRTLFKTVDHISDKEIMIQTLVLIEVLLSKIPENSLEKITQIRLMLNNISTSSTLRVIENLCKAKESSEVQICALQLLRIITRINPSIFTNMQLFLSDLQLLIYSQSPYVKILVVQLICDIICHKSSNISNSDKLTSQLIYSLQNELHCADELVKCSAVKCLSTVAEQSGMFKRLIQHECWNAMILRAFIDQSEISGVIHDSLLQYLEMILRERDYETNCWIHSFQPINLAFLIRLVNHLETSLAKEDISNAEICIRILNSTHIIHRLNNKPEILDKVNQSLTILNEMKAQKTQTFSNKTDNLLFSTSNNLNDGIITIPKSKCIVFQSLLYS